MSEKNVISCRYPSNMKKAVEECATLGLLRSCVAVEVDHGVVLEETGDWQKMVLAGVRLSTGGVRGVVRAAASVLQIFHEKGETHGGINLSCFYKDPNGKIGVAPPTKGSLHLHTDLHMLGTLLCEVLRNSRDIPSSEMNSTVAALASDSPPTAAELLSATSWLQLPLSLYHRSNGGTDGEETTPEVSSVSIPDSFDEGIQQVLSSLPSLPSLPTLPSTVEDSVLDVSALTPVCRRVASPDVKAYCGTLASDVVLITREAAVPRPVPVGSRGRVLENRSVSSQCSLSATFEELDPSSPVSWTKKSKGRMLAMQKKLEEMVERSDQVGKALKLEKILS
eukprot:TRINITY_DN10373_c0_g1_i4.p1 TRINITY_DN10373_c0_g1~~TRINITY_DN10373_c0_g1_i4.p1  ORF type:complete len:337 (+),score=52.26 TRINITY_DN10373_c0_g1_i4:64-1074(+)